VPARAASAAANKIEHIFFFLFLNLVLKIRTDVFIENVFYARETNMNRTNLKKKLFHFARDRTV